MAGVMDAGVVLRERQLQNPTGCSSVCEGEREGWGNFSLPGSVTKRWKRRKWLLAGVGAWRDGAEPPLLCSPRRFWCFARRRSLAASYHRRRIIARRRSFRRPG